MLHGVPQRTTENKFLIPLPIQRFIYANGKKIAGVAENAKSKRGELFKGKTAD
jgi:hypothetical protein